MNTSSLSVTATASVVSPALDLITPAEAAAVLRCTPWTVVRFIYDGLLPAARPIGPLGPWLIRCEDFAQFINSAAPRTSVPAVP